MFQKIHGDTIYLFFWVQIHLSLFVVVGGTRGYLPEEFAEAIKVHFKLQGEKIKAPNLMGSSRVDGSEILHQLRLVVYPMIYRVLYIPGGAGLLPPTVSSTFFENGAGKKSVRFFFLDFFGDSNLFLWLFGFCY